MRPSEFIQKGELRQKIGSSTQPEASGYKIVLNFCDVSGNDWDDDSHEKTLEKRWSKVALEYKRWYRSQYSFKVGEIREVPLQSDICVVNMLVRDKYGTMDHSALEQCIDKVGEKSTEYSGVSVHVQSFNEDWDKIEVLLISKIIKRGKMVTIYSNDKE